MVPQFSQDSSKRHMMGVKFISIEHVYISIIYFYDWLACIVLKEKVLEDNMDARVPFEMPSIYTAPVCNWKMEINFL